MSKAAFRLILVSAALLAVTAVHLVAQQRWPWSNDGYGDGDSRNAAGQFDYYALVLSWSPTYCSDEGEDDNTQCNRRDGKRYSFVLHGLWPQFEHGYPSACHLPRRPFVPQSVIDRMLDIMPSKGLVIHEYRTHGTCSGLDPNQYFSLAHRLFDGIAIPPRFQNPFEAQRVSPYDIRSEFLQANPSFAPNMIAIVCGGSGKSLKEVRLCVAKDGKPRACGDNENQSRLCSTDQVYIPPTRSTARDERPARPAPPIAPSTTGAAPQSPLPGPRMDYDYGRHSE
jgi:ribonuclease T2